VLKQVTHWGQQVFYLPTTIPLSKGETKQINGTMEMVRSKEYSRLYNVQFQMIEDDDTKQQVELTYQIV